MSAAEVSTADAWAVAMILSDQVRALRAELAAFKREAEERHGSHDADIDELQMGLSDVVRWATDDMKADL